MDRGPAIDDVCAEQGVFTSVRSPTGAGYRLISVSPGLTPEEKREITQRAPSHRALSDDAPDASGLSSYRLDSGRRCIALTRHAGLEHTGRGGLRVHTHFVVLAPEDFRVFACNPLGVRDALLAVIGDTPQLKPAPRSQPICLARRRLDCKRRPADPPMRLAPEDARRPAALLSQIMVDRRLVVCGCPAPDAAVPFVLSALPLTMRETLSFSFGLKLSTSRPFTLTFARQQDADAKLASLGDEVVRFAWESPPPVLASAFDAWLRFARDRWLAGRLLELDQLAARLVHESAPEALESIVILARDLDAIKTADRERHTALIQKYATAGPRGEVANELLRRFKDAAQKRDHVLTASEQAEQPAETTEPAQASEPG